MPEQILGECQNRGARINRFSYRLNFSISMQTADKRITTLAKTNGKKFKMGFTLNPPSIIIRHWGKSPRL